MAKFANAATRQAHTINEDPTVRAGRAPQPHLAWVLLGKGLDLFLVEKAVAVLVEVLEDLGAKLIDASLVTVSEGLAKFAELLLVERAAWDSKTPWTLGA